jgi:hypothetical protein
MSTTRLADLGLESTCAVCSVQPMSHSEDRYRGPELEPPPREESRDADRAATANLEAALVEVWRRADRETCRVTELEAELASTRESVSRVAVLEADLARVRHELAVVYQSRTWRWGAPIGRFLQTLGFMRRR